MSEQLFALYTTYTTAIIIIIHFFVFIPGLYTGSIYRDPGLLHSGHFPGEEYQDGRVVVVKTHGMLDSSEYQRAVLLIRNPFDAILAEYNRQQTQNQTQIAARDSFKTIGKIQYNR